MKDKDKSLEPFPHNSDFSGKTAFVDLTPDQKLEWLSHAAAFVWEARISKEKQKKKN